ncbi:mechanosensitive ion channel family protein [Chryseobacterium taklimakanense]|uniref:mechanosensitive ion channel family protein n=1 Tax=Chryseobacterium taklimakanense TaxID=536441 RepID=UPI00374261D6
MDESKKYIDLVIGVLENWWVKFAEFTPNLIVGILVFLFFLYTSKFLSKISVDLFQKLFPKSRNQDTVITLIGFFRFLIILIGTFITLEIMGLSGFFIKFLGSLGVAGIIAGVALKDIVSSMFSGMLVSVDKAFKVGDYVTINNISGTVEEIGFLTTKVINDEGKKVFIPNQMILVRLSLISRHHNTVKSSLIWRFQIRRIWKKPTAFCSMKFKVWALCRIRRVPKWCSCVKNWEFTVCRSGFG